MNTEACSCLMHVNVRMMLGKIFCHDKEKFVRRFNYHSDALQRFF